MPRRLAALLLATVALAACHSVGPADPDASGPTPAPTASRTVSPSASVPGASDRPSPSASVQPQPGADPVISRISDQQWARMVAAEVWRQGCPVGRSGLRRVSVSYHDFAGGVSRGALIVNADVAASVARIFGRIFDTGFPIERMRPIEAYGGDDLASMKADNTSAFNCRQPGQANSPSRLSPHANGRAIDINPYRNPWTDPRCGCWQPSATYAQKPRKAPGVITKGGDVWRIFTHEGWIWQDISVTDYMHFDTGYPSVGPPSAASEKAG